MRWQARLACSALCVGALGVAAASCGPALTVGALVGLDATQSDDDDSGTPPVASVTTPSGLRNDVIEIDYRLTDAQGDRAHITVEFDDGSGFAPATPAFAEGSEGTANLTATVAGADHTFLWNSTEDLGFTNATGLRIRITPADVASGILGTSATTDDFSVFNEYMTTLAQRPTVAGITPLGVSVATDGDLLVADGFGHRALRVDSVTGETSLLAGTGEAGYNGDGQPGAASQLNLPVSIAGVADGSDDVIVVDAFNALIRRIDADSGFITTIAGGGGDFGENVIAQDALIFPRDLALDDDDNPFVLADGTRMRLVNRGGTPLVLEAGSDDPFGDGTSTYQIAPAQIATVTARFPGNGRSSLVFPPNNLGFEPQLDEPAAVASWGGPTSPEPRLVYILQLGKLGGDGGGGAGSFGPSISVVNLGSTIQTFETSTGTVPVAPGDAARLNPTGGVPNLGDFADLTLLDSHLMALTTNRTAQVIALNFGPTDRTVAGTSVPSGAGVAVAGIANQPDLLGDGLSPLNANLAGGFSLASDGDGNLFVGEAISRVRVVAGASGLSFGGQTIPANTVGSIPVVPPGTVPGIVHPLAITPGPGSDLIVTDLDAGDPRSNRIYRLSSSDASVTTVVGSGVFGNTGDGGPAADARLGGSVIGAVNPQGTVLVFADPFHHTVRAVNLSSTALTLLTVTIQPGEVETVVGTGTASVDPFTVGDGSTPTSATLNAPISAFFDGQGLLYVHDSGNNRVRVCNPRTSTVTVAGVTVAPNRIETLAGTGDAGLPSDDGDGGAASSAKLSGGASLPGNDGNIYVLDGADGVSAESRCRVINLGTTDLTLAGVTVGPGEIDTIAGSGVPQADDDSNLGDGGPATSATFESLSGVSMRSDGLLFLCDGGDDRIRVVNTRATSVDLGGVRIAAGEIETIIGTGVPGFVGDVITVAAGFFGSPGPGPVNEPTGVLALDDGRLFFADQNNGAVRMANLTSGSKAFAGIAAAPGEVVVIAGSRSGSTRPELPQDLRVDGNGAVIFSDTGNFSDGPLVKQIDQTTRILTVVAGNGEVTRIDETNLGDGGPAVLASLNNPRGLSLDSSGSVYLADAGNARIRFVNRGSSATSPIPGLSVEPLFIDTAVDGTWGDGDPENDLGKSAVHLGVNETIDLSFPTSVAVAGDSIFVCDTGNDRVIRVDRTTGIVDGNILGPQLVGPTIADPFTGPQSVLDDADQTFASTGIVPGNLLVIVGVTAGTLEVEEPPTSGTWVPVSLPTSFEITAPPTQTQLGFDENLRIVGGPGALDYRVVRPVGITPTAIAAASGSQAYVAYELFGSGTFGNVVAPLTYGPAVSQWSLGVAIAGTGLSEWNGDLLQATAMNMGEINSLAVDGDLLLIADQGNHRIVGVNLGAGTLTVAGLSIGPGEARTIAGSGAGSSGFSGDAVPPDLSELNTPTGVDTDGIGVFLIDQGNNGRIRRFQR